MIKIEVSQSFDLIVEFLFIPKITFKFILNIPQYRSKEKKIDKNVYTW